MVLESNLQISHITHIVLVSKYYQLASTVILPYDYILTLDLEIEYLWSRFKLTPANVLFVLNRYFPLLSYFWIIAAYHETSWVPSVSTPCFPVLEMAIALTLSTPPTGVCFETYYNLQDFSRSQTYPPP
ncbi:hypothetical protein M0805_008591 [Coniferiporia weirii]|nr:hypothetical protein M0805_008591 [Coniferiporia weirii]